MATSWLLVGMVAIFVSAQHFWCLRCLMHLWQCGGAHHASLGAGCGTCVCWAGIGFVYLYGLFYACSSGCAVRCSIYDTGTLHPGKNSLSCAGLWRTVGSSTGQSEFNCVTATLQCWDSQQGAW